MHWAQHGRQDMAWRKGRQQSFYLQYAFKKNAALMLSTAFLATPMIAIGPPSAMAFTTSSTAHSKFSSNSISKSIFVNDLLWKGRETRVRSLPERHNYHDEEFAAKTQRHDNKLWLPPHMTAIFAGVIVWIGLTFQPAVAVESAPTQTTTTTTVETSTLPISTKTPTASTKATTPPYGKRYWSIMNNNDETDSTAVSSSSSISAERRWANMALLDYAVRTIATYYYDNSGGAYFVPQDFAKEWQTYSRQMQEDEKLAHLLETREGAVSTLKKMAKSLNDPYSQYLTREELLQELDPGQQYGFLGLGALVEVPPSPTRLQQNQNARFTTKPIVPAMMTAVTDTISNRRDDEVRLTLAAGSSHPFATSSNGGGSKTPSLLSVSKASQLPVVTAIVPDSPAERAGLVVGDRIVSVTSLQEDFLRANGQSSAKEVEKFNAKPTVQYFGNVELTVAKPLYVVPLLENTNNELQQFGVDGVQRTRSGATVGPSRDVVAGYRPTRVKLSVPTEPWSSTSAISMSTQSSIDSSTGIDAASHHKVSGGNHIVHYELLSSSSEWSILDRAAVNKRSLGGVDFTTSTPGSSPLRRIISKHNDDENKIGYIRLTRFSKASTSGLFEAIQALEEAGAQSYILDLRNNYGGVIQEAMLTASSFLQDCHSVLCFTLNSRGEFTPHDVQEYVLTNDRYPGYLLSGNDRSLKYLTLNQAKHDSHQTKDEGGAWIPPSSYASLHEQMLSRGLKRVSSSSFSSSTSYYEQDSYRPEMARIVNPQQRLLLSLATVPEPKKIVLLVNEGTASAAEVFASALHDNGRLVAMVGTRTYGKGLIQHTFALPDGGGLRLTVAEYLTPSLHHVTIVGNARFDSSTGEFVGGGIRPDVYCESNHGIPGSNVGADLCVGMALDVLEEADYNDVPK